MMSHCIYALPVPQQWILQVTSVEYVEELTVVEWPIRIGDCCLLDTILARVRAVPLVRQLKLERWAVVSDDPSPNACSIFGLVGFTTPQSCIYLAELSPFLSRIRVTITCVDKFHARWIVANQKISARTKLRVKISCLYNLLHIF